MQTVDTKHTYHRVTNCNPRKQERKKISIKTGRGERNGEENEIEDTLEEGEVGEKHLRLIIDHLSNRASSRGYPRNHYAPLCFRPLKIHPVSWPPSGASS